MASPPDLLISRKIDPLQVYIQTSALTIQQDGSTVATGVSDAPTPQGDQDFAYPNQCVVEAFGKRFFLRSGFVHERDQGGAGAWGTVYTFAAAVNANTHSGLHAFQINGEEALGFLYVDSTNAIRAVSTLDGVTWTETVAFSSITLRASGHALPWLSSIYWLLFMDGSPQYALAIYDFATGVFTRVVRPDGADFNTASSGLAVHKEKLFYWGTSGSLFPARHRLRRLDGVSFTRVYEATSRAFLHAALAGQVIAPSMLFTDPATGDLILLGNESDPADTANPPSKCGLFCVQIKGAESKSGLTDSSSPSDVVDLTTTVLPSDLRSTLNGGTHPDLMQDMLGVYVDTTTTPGTPVPFLYRARTTTSATSSWPQAQAWEWFEWKGVSALMTLVGSSVADGANFVVPATPFGGGSHLPNLGLGRFAFDGAPVEVAGGSIKVFFRVYGSGAAGSWKVYWGFSAPTAAMPLVAGTVAVVGGSPPTTPTNTGTQIDNVTPDGGSTLYSVEIDASGAGIGSGQRYFLLAVPV